MQSAERDEEKPGNQTARAAGSAHPQPTAAQSTTKSWGSSSGLVQPSSVHSDRRSGWRMIVPWQCSKPARQSRQPVLMRRS